MTTTARNTAAANRQWVADKCREKFSLAELLEIDRDAARIVNGMRRQARSEVTPLACVALRRELRRA